MGQLCRHGRCIVKQIGYSSYGSPDVLELREVEKPEPAANEVLVRVEAAAVNPLDWRRIRGDPYFLRLVEGLPRPRNGRLGADFAGRIETAGARVHEFAPGDEVYGDASSSGMGAFAQYISVPVTKVAPKPASISFEAAASVPIAGVTALQGLRDSGRIQAGESVLINGASGGVGTFAVQIAKAYGAEVTGVCSTRNLKLVRSIGADHVVDYTQEDFTRSGDRYDLVFDSVANRTLADYKRALNPGGRFVMVGFSTLSHMLQVTVGGAWVSRTGDRRMGSLGMVNSKREDLLQLNELLESGKVAAVIDRRYPLEETAQALRHVESHRARGKVIITIGESAEETS